jgi:HD-GYP domain-containing protein (c-di-GMP phosphodiesterase class II)
MNSRLCSYLHGLILSRLWTGFKEGVGIILIKNVETIKEFCSRGMVTAGWGENASLLQPDTSLQAAEIVAVMIDKVCERSLAILQEELAETKNIHRAILGFQKRTLGAVDPEIEQHSERLQGLAVQLGLALDLSQAELDELYLLALVHDIGKVSVPKEILLKPGPLSPQEMTIIKLHPEVGYRIACSIPELAATADKIRSHHERWDGGGYPRGLREREIPFLSRIIAIVDAFDVMIEGRVYCQAVSRQEALWELNRCAASQFDPELVRIFVSLMEEF